MKTCKTAKCENKANATKDLCWHHYRENLRPLRSAAQSKAMKKWWKAKKKKENGNYVVAPVFTKPWHEKYTTVSLENGLTLFVNTKTGKSQIVSI